MRCELDHLVVACKDLDQGAAWLADRLGIAPQPGGQHVLMGTPQPPAALPRSFSVERDRPQEHRPPPARLSSSTRANPGAPAESPQCLTWVVRSLDKIDRGSQPAVCACPSANVFARRAVARYRDDLQAQRTLVEILAGERRDIQFAALITETGVLTSVRSPA